MIESEDRSRLGKRAWAVTLAALAAYCAGRLVPLPGIDDEGLRTGVSDLSLGLLRWLNLAPPLATIFSMGVVTLVVVRGVLGIVAQPDWDEARLARAERRTFGIYVVVALLLAFVQATAIETFAEANPDMSAVESPGWGFRGLATVTLATGAVLLWAIANWIGRSGIGQGALVLAAFEMLLAGTNDLFDAGGRVALGSLSPLVAPLLLAGTFAPALVLASLAIRRPRFPVRLVGRLQFLSPVDAALAPALATYAASQVAGSLTAAASLAPERVARFIVAPGGIVALLGAVAISVFLRLRGAERGDARLWIPAILLPACAGGLFAIGFLVHSPTESRAYAGDRSFEAEIACRLPLASTDAPTLERRLHELGVDAEVEPAGTKRLRVRMEDVRDAREVFAGALPPRRLAFRLVAQDQSGVRPTGERIEGLTVETDTQGHLVWAAPTPESLAPIVARAPESAAVECETMESGSNRCTPWLLEPAALTHEDVANAHLELDQYVGDPMVTIDFSPDGAQRFADLTAAAIDRKLAIVVDGRILSAPVIRSRIAGGRAQITLGAVGGTDRKLREARDLAAALDSGVLACDWTIASVRAAD